MRLIINGTQIADTQIILSRTSIRPGRLSRRSGLTSVDFEINASAANLLALGFPNANYTPQAKTRISASIEDGPQIATGYVQIVKYSKFARKITLTFFADAREWYGDIQGLSLQDIDLQEYDHFWTLAEIVSSWGNTDGYVYPLLNYGNLTNVATIATEISDWFPAVYQHTLVREIFQQKDWKVAGSGLQNPLYNSVCVPFTQGLFQTRVSYTDKFLTNVARSGSQTFSYTAANVADSGTSPATEVDITTAISDPDGLWSFVDNEYTAPEAVSNLNFRATFDLSSISLSITDPSGAAPAATAQAVVQFVKNGSVAQETVLYEYSTTTTGTGTQVGPFVANFQSDMDAGDKMAVQVVFKWSDLVAGVSDVNFSLFSASIFLATTDAGRIIRELGAVTLENNLPDITQSAFIEDVITRHGFVVSTDFRTKTVYFTRFEDLAASMVNAPDWAQYILGQEIETDFIESTDGFARRSVFRYAEPDQIDIYATGYNDSNEYPLGSGILNVDYEFLAQEADYYTSPFVPTYQITAKQSDVSAKYSLAHIPHYTYDGEADASPRVLIVLRDVDFNSVAKIPGLLPANFTILNDGTPEGFDNCAWGYFTKGSIDANNSALDAFTDSLSYGPPNLPGTAEAGLLADCWNRFRTSLNSGQYLRVRMRLPANVFSSFNPGQAIQIQGYGISGYFFIDTIENYAGPNEWCEVGLLPL